MDLASVKDSGNDGMEKIMQDLSLLIDFLGANEQFIK